MAQLTEAELAGLDLIIAAKGAGITPAGFIKERLINSSGCAELTV